LLLPPSSVALTFFSVPTPCPPYPHPSSKVYHHSLSSFARHPIQSCLTSPFPWSHVLFFLFYFHHCLFFPSISSSYRLT
jgi:hypothetical protein